MRLQPLVVILYIDFISSTYIVDWFDSSHLFCRMEMFYMCASTTPGHGSSLHLYIYIYTI